MPVSAFDIAVRFVLDHEGGLTNDTEGLTKYGISQGAFPNLDIAALTQNYARNI